MKVLRVWTPLRHDIIFWEVVEVAKRGRIVKDPPGRGKFQKTAAMGAVKYAILGALRDDDYKKGAIKVSGKKIRDTVTYELRDGRKAVYRGITSDPERRAATHLADGKKFTKMVVTSSRMTRKGAARKEAKLLETYQRNHGGKLPKYNQTKKG